MRVLVSVCSHEIQHVGAIRSAYRITTHEGDAFVDEWKYRGDVAREMFVKTFLEDDTFGPEDALLLLDGDQRHPPDMLDRLRAHDLDMVCAHYYRRETRPIQSLCYEVGDGRWPYLPMMFPPRTGLHEIAVTGFGCVLIKKKVFRDVKAQLPPGASPIAIGPIPEIAGDHDNWGPDFKFFHMARKLGYKLWLDASIESLHAVTVWLGHKSADRLTDYEDVANAAHDIFLIRLEMHGMHLEAFKQRKRILEARYAGLIDKAKQMTNAPIPERENLSIAIYQLEGKILEMSAWIEWAEKYPAIERPDQLPTNGNTPAQASAQDEVPDEATAKAIRQEAYRDNAVELAEMLPDAGQ